MGRIARKRMHKNIRDNQRKFRTRKRTKDLDQIQEDLLPQNVNKLKDQLAQDPDLPGMGQFYCVECSRHFIDDRNLQEHLKSKGHKKRLKLLKEEAYTQKEAELAVGMKTENQRPKSQGDSAMLHDAGQNAHMLLDLLA